MGAWLAKYVKKVLEVMYVVLVGRYKWEYMCKYEFLVLPDVVPLARFKTFNMKRLHRMKVQNFIFLVELGYITITWSQVG